MLLRITRALPEAEIASILRAAKELGYRSRFLEGRSELLELTGPGAPGHRAALADLTGVAQILDAGEARELHEAAGREPTRVEIGEARFGAGDVSLVAGPCAVEDAGRLLEIAWAVRAAGATLLRGGAYKPRTSPYAFQGLGPAGLEVLAAVKAETGLGVLTEVLDPRDVDRVGEVADAFQVGARNMANYALLRELAQRRKPVVLKRGFGATVDELLGAAEYLLAGGNEQVVLCERGVRGFDRVTRNLLDVGAIAHLALATHLPVIADPSHAAGRSDLVRPLARAALAAGADGLMIEVHSAPAEVHSDGAQAISPDCFAAVARDAAALAGLDGRRLVTPADTASAGDAAPIGSPAAQTLGGGSRPSRETCP